MGESEWIAFKNRRVVAWSQYPFTDDAIPDSGDGPLRRLPVRHQVRERAREARRLRRVPLPVLRAAAVGVAASRSSAACAPAGEGADVTVESRAGKGKWKRLAHADRPARRATSTATSRVVGAAKRQFRFRYGRRRRAAPRAPAKR